MRYTTPIFFQCTEPGAYDEKTGNYAADSIIETKRYADVTDSGTETLNLVYNELKQGSLTVRLQMPYKAKFDRLRIGGKTYRVDFARRQKYFVVSEIQNG